MQPIGTVGSSCSYFSFWSKVFESAVAYRMREMRSYGFRFALNIRKYNERMCAEVF